MKNKRSFFGRLLRGAAVLALTAVLFSALPALKAKAAAGEVTLSDDGTLTLSGAVKKDQIQAYQRNNRVKAVVAKKGTVLPVDCSGLFLSIYAQTIDLSNASFSKVTNMSSMFGWCKNLKSLDVSSFDTSKVTNMSDMFFGCYNLTALDLSCFDTSKVTSMRQMFLDCNKLAALDLSSFDTSKVTRMDGMFDKCWSLTSLDLSSFDTSNVTAMRSMFKDCRSLTSLNVRSFDISKIPDEDLETMFLGCNKQLQNPFAGSPFLKHPQDTAGTLGNNAVFTVKAKGTGLTYRWQYNNGHGWRNSGMEGCKTASVSVPYLYYRNGQQYRCIVKDASGEQFVSYPATMYVKLITCQWTVRVECTGQYEDLTFGTAGYNLKYQWQFNNGHGWKNSSMPGNTTPKLTVQCTTNRVGQRYRCIVTAPCGIIEISKEIILVQAAEGGGHADEN